MNTAPIFLVDDEPDALQGLALMLHAHGLHQVRRCQDPRLVIDLLDEERPDCIILDLTMPQMSGEELLEHLHQHHPDIPVIVVTGVDLVDTAVRCMRLGAVDYLVKPVDEARLVASLQRIVEAQELHRENARLRSSLLRGTLADPAPFADIITRSPAMLGIFQYVEAVAATSQPVLITGETGTGKELLARALHQISGRTGALVSVNVAGLDDHLFSDTLFGHRKGAFTGADSQRPGLVEQAANGTLFLDEIGDLDTASQVKLLRLLQEREYRPLGSDVAKRSSARVICATHCDLLQAQAEGRFRRDLYYRLRAHHIEVPALRHRREDLPVLVDHFLNQAAAELKRSPTPPPPGLLDLLNAHDFPGNVRELEAMILDAVSRQRQGPLPLDGIRDVVRTEPSTASSQQTDDPQLGIHFGDRLPSLTAVQNALIDAALERCQHNRSAAAAILGISRQALHKRLAAREQ